MVMKIVGWVPDQIIEAEASRLRQRADEAMAITQGHENPQAEDLKNAAVELRAIADRQVMLYRQMCRAFLSRN